MSRKTKSWGLGVLQLVFLIICGFYLSSVNIPVLQPKGVIADKEYRLLLSVVGIMCIVVVPVFILLGYIVYKYRDTNKSKKTYSPDWDHSRYIEGAWWLIPTIIIVVLSVVAWNASYALNPYKPIASTNRTLNIQVVALDWKWLFIYPSLNIASVNKVLMPLDTPVHFYLTADAPMNSFWIPQLSGQIYAMPGMQTQLYVMANQAGSYNGWSANISGIGFASMMFSAQVVTHAKFKSWLDSVRSSQPPHLTQAAFNKLDRPSAYLPPKFYVDPAPNLFSNIIEKYMAPGQGMAM